MDQKKLFALFYSFSWHIDLFVYLSIIDNSLCVCVCVRACVYNNYCDVQADD